jgi:hypothetical protein
MPNHSDLIARSFQPGPIQSIPSRFDRLLHVEAHIGQAIEILERIGEMDLAKTLREIERAVLDLQEAKPEENSDV